MELEAYWEEEYHKRLREEFRKLSAIIFKSKCPCFDAEVARRAWNFTELYAAEGNSGKGRRLDLNPVYYVYVLMDPRRPGPWVITLPGGMSFELPFLPFYVGKGKGKRMQQHLMYAHKRERRKLELSNKESKILEIEHAGFEVVQKRISTKLIDAVALAKERILIKAIGRTVSKEGPLANLAKGGDGASGVIWSQKTLRRRRRGLKRFWETRTEEEKQEIMANLRAKGFSVGGTFAGKSHSAETKELFSILAKLRPEDYYLKSFHSLKAREKAKDSLSDGRMQGINKGIERSQEFKDSVSKFQKARIHSTEQNAAISNTKKKQNQEYVTCPHCSKVGKPAGMKTWHFDNCPIINPAKKKVRAAKGANSSRRLREANKILVTCPHCDKEGYSSGMKTWHFDNCKFKEV